MARTVYVPQGDAATLTWHLKDVKSPNGLHALMKFEVLNFTDGTRTAWEVYEAVAAEALSAGVWYYGTVSPGDVLSVLESAREAGAFSVETR
jgi:hypothetical protein